jgi:hypothetical protein
LESTEQLGFGYIPICYQIAEKRSCRPKIADSRLLIEERKFPANEPPSFRFTTSCRRVASVAFTRQNLAADSRLRRVFLFLPKFSENEALVIRDLIESFSVASR